VRDGKERREMDPNEILRLMREVVAEYRKPQPSSDSLLADLVQQVEAMDEWLSKGGFLPSAWEREEEDDEDESFGERDLEKFEVSGLIVQVYLDTADGEWTWGVTHPGLREVLNYGIADSKEEARQVASEYARAEAAKESGKGVT
jgi:hypothetical protein